MPALLAGNDGTDTASVAGSFGDRPVGNVAEKMAAGEVPGRLSRHHLLIRSSCYLHHHLLLPSFRPLPFWGHLSFVTRPSSSPALLLVQQTLFQCDRASLIWKLCRPDQCHRLQSVSCPCFLLQLTQSLCKISLDQINPVLMKSFVFFLGDIWMDPFIVI